MMKGLLNLPIIFWTLAATAVDLFHIFFCPLGSRMLTTAAHPVSFTHQQVKLMIKCILEKSVYTLSEMDKR